MDGVRHAIDVVVAEPAGAPAGAVVGRHTRWSTEAQKITEYKGTLYEARLVVRYASSHLDEWDPQSTLSGSLSGAVACGIAKLYASTVAGHVQ